ncbi:MAG: carbamoyl-phosphate synthase large subunit [Chloroflexota bacterium]|nr:MAG: carbamoyl-phosphate synthase large subunit [Chloroflexota bacterium]
MKSTGETMAIDRTFEAALQKAVRSLEFGSRTMLWEDARWAAAVGQGARAKSQGTLEESEIKEQGSIGGSEVREDGSVSPEPASAPCPLPLAPNVETGLAAINALIDQPNDLRLWAFMAALRRGATIEDLHARTRVDPWFLQKMRNIVEMEKRLLSESLTPELLREAKRMGFGDEQVATLADRLPEQVRALRRQWAIQPVYKMVDTCAAEFAAATPYFYSTYEVENEATPMPGKKAVVIGSGPIRIGQGIEFDYCSVHSAWALQEEGVASIMINSNPETVSTDFDTSTRLYFEALDEESVRDILENEAGPENPALARTPVPSIVQFGGQTAINLADPLHRAGQPILGSSAEAIDLAEDRRRFEDLMSRLGVPQPPGGAVTGVEEALKVAKVIGYPVLVRPSYVLGGRAMEIVHSASELIRYVTMAAEISSRRPILIDKYFEGKEVEVDAICDGERVLIPGIMEHIERAGVHSGDSMAVYPGVNLTEFEVNTLVDYTERMGLALQVRGLMNVQFVILREPIEPGESSQGAAFTSSVYVLEVNPRASRTVPFLSKVTGVPMVRIATRVMLGKTLAEQGYQGGLWKRQKLVGIKAPVFSMSKLVGVDTYLGPEMKSTGEVMGIDYTLEAALVKAVQAAGLMLPRQGNILLSIADRDKPEALPLIRDLARLGYNLYATEGTAAMLEAVGLPVTMITKKLQEGYPNVIDVIRERVVHGVINTLTGDRAPLKDGFEIRRAAVEHRIPCFTSLDTARAVVQALLDGECLYTIQPLPAYRTPQ